MRKLLVVTSIALSLSLFGAAAHAMTSDQALAPAKAANLEKDGGALAKLQTAAQGGDANAQNSLGYMYANGQGVPQD